MKERGIPFNAPMVRALLAGTKTQTRRAVKGVDSNNWICLKGGFGMHVVDERSLAACPYGVPGDRLWVREAWRAPREFDKLPGSKLPIVVVAESALGFEADRVMSTVQGNSLGRYRHARFMPRWASRITLEITDVRVQRLQDISEEDARAEGVAPETWGADASAGAGHVIAYAYLWNEINGGPTKDTAPPGPLGGAWATNPWAWALTFARVTP